MPSKSAPTPKPSDDRGRHSVPDRRLASLFIKRSALAPATAQRVGMVGSYRPARHGPAAFAGSLRDALLADRPGMAVGVVSVESITDDEHAPEVLYRLSPSDGEFQCKAAAAELNKFDVALIQFDVSSFGGAAGEQALQVLNWIRVPAVVVLHDVPGAMTDAARSVLKTLGESADAVVTMSETARQRLVTLAGIPARKIMVIQHGARLRQPMPTRTTDPAHRPVILTWGLLEPVKGIEWALEAMSALRHLRPLPRYLVVGPTHPRELALDGDRYHNALMARAGQLDLAAMVEFRHGLASEAELQELIGSADIVLLPHCSAGETTSAVLVEAIAARKPVVATRFAHAQELLDGEHGGLLVAHEDPQQMAAAIERLLSDPNLGAQLVEKASGLAKALSWPSVAAQYRQLFDALLRRPGSHAP